MNWLVEIEWMDGETENIPVCRLSQPSPMESNLILYVNEHGHDRRHDMIIIPLRNVRKYKITEVQ